MQLGIATVIPILFAALLLTLQSVIANPDDNYRTWLEDDYDWDEFYDDEIGRESVEKVCDAPEDYKKHKEACEKAYSKIEKEEEAAREAYPYIVDKSPLPPTKEYKENVIDKLTEEQKEQKKETIQEYKKEVCENLGAMWEGEHCDTKGNDKKTAQFLDETQNIRDDFDTSGNGSKGLILKSGGFDTSGSK